MQSFFTASLVGLTASVVALTERWNIEVSMKDYTTYYYDNEVDHFNDEDDRMYKQRYWYNDNYFNYKEDAPVFLYLCGEWTCSPPDEKMFPMMVGAEHEALLVTLEHRYYGDSQPFDDWSTDNLELLTSQQALADIAHFIDGQNEVLGYKADWIVIGGSYPGALSAWFKSQYPDHAVGAWSSSGVIHAIEDYQSFDMDIFMRTDSSSPVCTHAIRMAHRIADDELKTPEGIKRIQDLLSIDMPIDQRDFWYYFADIFVSSVQYGNRVTMCDNLEKASATNDPDTLMQAVAANAASVGLTYNGYDATVLANTEIDINSAGRQWIWQQCNEFGFFQTPNVEQPMRHSTLRLPFWQDYCKRIFGRPILTQEDKTNAHYGGLDIEGDNIFFLNGSEDPWQYAAMRQLKHPETTQSTMTAYYIKCDSCAHCVDTHSPTPDQPQALTDAQTAVADAVAGWLSEAQAKRNAAVFLQ